VGRQFDDYGHPPRRTGEQAMSAFVCFNRKSLESLLPHRGAALRKIDGVFYNSGTPKMLIGFKEIRIDDPDLEGHFPQAPTYPGYAQDEFACLVAAALIPIAIEGLKTDPHVVQKIVRYKKNVVPGDQLIAEVRLTGRRGKFFMFTADIRNQCQEVVAEYEKIIGAV
jgi:3-hydroxymyristoyl/3-hydroxydecanoyl-(acyl carrier protein) dehydratase